MRSLWVAEMPVTRAWAALSLAELSEVVSREVGAFEVEVSAGMVG